MAKKEIVNYQFKKGQTGNKNGRPKGSFSKKPMLLKIIKDIISIKSSVDVSPAQLNIIYQLYEIVTSDYVCDTLTTTINHLYFIESDFGIKIGISKDVQNRLSQIKQYAPSSEILKIIPFGGNFEKKLHTKFRKQNIKNNPLYGIEWFYKNDDLINFINDINKSSDLCNIFGSDKIGQLKFDF